MSKKVDRWLGYGRKRCAKGDHWYIMHYSDYMVCPICGDRQEYGDAMPEYNGYIVCEPKFEKAVV